MKTIHYGTIGLAMLGIALVVVGMYVNTDEIWAIVDPTIIILYIIIAAISVIGITKSR